MRSAPGFLSFTKGRSQWRRPGNFTRYEENLESNLADLAKRLKCKAYRARLVRRKYIPKGQGKLRPLGIPVLEDKLVQIAATQILQAIYEVDFLPCSYGYRPGVGAHNAIRTLSNELQLGGHHFVVEADIKGFFDYLRWDWLERMLEQRIQDRAFLNLIRKWLRAGILEEDGRVSHPLTGTPQGGVVTPLVEAAAAAENSSAADRNSIPAGIVRLHADVGSTPQNHPHSGRVCCVPVVWVAPPARTICPGRSANRCLPARARRRPPHTR